MRRAGTGGGPMPRNFGNSCALQRQEPLHSMRYRGFGGKKCVCREVLALFPIKILELRGRGGSVHVNEFSP